MQQYTNSSNIKSTDAVLLPTKVILWIERIILVAFAIVVVYYTYNLLSKMSDFFVDDAYITLRYAKNFVNHHQLTWNINEPRVEGYSNFLFVVLGSLALYLKLDPLLFLKSISLVALLLSFMMTYKLSRLWLSPVAAIAPVILQMSFYGFFYWAASGLETIVYQLFIATALYFLFTTMQFNSPESEKSENFKINRLYLVLTFASLCACIIFDSITLFIITCILLAATFGCRPKKIIANNNLSSLNFSSSHIIFISLFFFLAAITRIEGAAVFAIIWLTLLSHYVFFGRSKNNIRKQECQLLTRILLMVALPYTIYFIWRWSYYGQLFPNPVYCKGIFVENFIKKPGFLLKEFLRYEKILIILHIAALCLIRDLRIIILSVIIFFYYIITIHFDGVVGQLHRHYIVLIPLLCIIACVAIHHTITSIFNTFPKFIVAIITLVTILNMCYPNRTINQVQFETLYKFMTTRNRVLINSSNYLVQRANAQDTIATGEVGLLGYLSDAKIIDLMCLNCREITQSSFKYSQSRFTEYLMDIEPEIIGFYYIKPNSYNEVLELYSVEKHLKKHPKFTGKYSKSKAFKGSYRTDLILVFYEHTNQENS